MSGTPGNGTAIASSQSGLASQGRSQWRNRRLERGNAVKVFRGEAFRQLA